VSELIGACVSIEVMIVGSAAAELEQMLRALGVRCSSVALTELLHHRTARRQAAERHYPRHARGRRFPPAVALLKDEHPSTGVVIVAKSHDPALMLEAMRAGVTSG
jgi:DNA-binding NarL/FixJ family response regulator